MKHGNMTVTAFTDGFLTVTLKGVKKWCICLEEPNVYTHLNICLEYNQPHPEVV